MPVTAIKLDSDTLAMLDAAVAEGRACIAEGDFYTQEDVEAENTFLRAEIMRQKCG